MHCVVKYHIENREGFLERCGCKKAKDSEEASKSHPEKMAMSSVLQHWEAISNKKSSGTPKPGTAPNPEHLGASELPPCSPCLVDEDSWWPLLWHFYYWKHSLWERLERFKNKFEVFPYSPDTFFSLNCKASIGFWVFFFNDWFSQSFNLLLSVLSKNVSLSGKIIIGERLTQRTKTNWD